VLPRALFPSLACAAVCLERCTHPLALPKLMLETCEHATAS